MARRALAWSIGFSGLITISSGAYAQIGPMPPPAPPSTGTAAPTSTAQPAPSDQAPAPAPSAPASSAEATTPQPAPRGPPPSRYYVEPSQPPGARPAPPPPRYYEPPPPVLVHEPLPPPVVHHRAPKTSLWVGPRLGWLIPSGTLWHDGFYCYDPFGNVYRCYHARTFSDYASPGPFFEIDAGARLGRLYNVFALWEHASLGTGGLDENSFGGQSRGDTNLYGIGLRFSTEPDTVGFLIELGLGYRQFTAHWDDGTSLKLTDGWFDAHIGLGADIRFSRMFSISPMVTLGSGGFGSAGWEGTKSGDATNGFDVFGQYNTLTFQIGAHFDLLSD